jgi:uncharacterized protein YhbP (UPF0306 family)
MDTEKASREHLTSQAVMNIEELIKKYLNEAKIMQLGTAADNQPWVVSVHFAADDKLNLYWISDSSRRHSLEIANNSKVSATIPIKFPDHPVIGVSAEGEAGPVSSADAINICAAKFGLSEGFKKKLLDDTAGEKLYCLKPRLFVLFDQVSFPDVPRQEWNPR